jgi:chorismate-pyruvate lyase
MVEKFQNKSYEEKKHRLEMEQQKILAKEKKKLTQLFEQEKAKCRVELEQEKAKLKMEFTLELQKRDIERLQRKLNKKKN